MWTCSYRASHWFSLHPQGPRGKARCHSPPCCQWEKVGAVAAALAPGSFHPPKRCGITHRYNLGLGSSGAGCNKPPNVTLLQLLWLQPLPLDQLHPPPLRHQSCEIQQTSGSVSSPPYLPYAPLQLWPHPTRFRRQHTVINIAIINFVKKQRYH